MINRIHRFRGFKALRFVYSRGKIARGPLFAVKVWLNPHRRGYRAAVVVSRKVSKSAVVRNRIRRRIYETLRQMEPQISSQADIVISVFSDTLKNEPSGKLKQQLKSQLRQAGALKA